MFQRMINDLKDSTGTALRLTSLAAAAAGALFIATSVLCAAAFVVVYERYGLVEARAARAAEAAKSAMQTALSDPMLVAAGLQVIRAIGVKKLIPILAVGGLVLGFLASRDTSGQSDDDEAP